MPSKQASPSMASKQASRGSPDPRNGAGACTRGEKLFKVDEGESPDKTDSSADESEDSPSSSESNVPVAKSERPIQEMKRGDSLVTAKQ